MAAAAAARAGAATRPSTHAHARAAGNYVSFPSRELIVVCTAAIICLGNLFSVGIHEEDTDTVVLNESSLLITMRS